MAFIRKTLVYTLSGVLAQGLQVVQMIAVRVMIRPEILGIWNLTQVICEFCKTLRPGLDVVSQIELSKLRGQKDEEGARRLEKTLFDSSFVFYLVVGLGVLVYGYFQGRLSDPLLALGLVVAVAFVVFDSMSDVAIVMLRAEDSFVALSKALALAKIFSVSVIILGAYLGNIWGLFVGALLGVTLRLTLLLRANRFPGRLKGRRWAKDVFKTLASRGVKMRLVDYPLSLLRVGDVLVVSAFYEPKSLALYVTAKNIVTAATMVVNYLRSVFILRLYRLVGAGESEGKIGDKIVASVIVESLILLPMVVIAVFVSAHLAIGRFLTDYGGSIEILKWSLMILFFSSGFEQLRSLVMAKYEFGKILLINTVALVVGLLLLVRAKATGELSLVACAQIYFCSIGAYWLFVLGSTVHQVGWTRIIRTLLATGVAVPFAFWSVELGQDFMERGGQALVLTNPLVVVAWGAVVLVLMGFGFAEIYRSGGPKLRNRFKRG